MKVQAFNLSVEEKIRLQNIEKYDENWRIRERAKSLLLLATGLTCKQIAEQLGLNFRTISFTRKHWNEEKFQSLPDRPRPGAPLKITQDEQDNILTWVQAEPLSSQQVLAKHLDTGGTAVHVNTIVNLLRKNEFVWKRTRHSLKKKGMKPIFARPRAKSHSCARAPMREKLCSPTSMRQVFRQFTPTEAHGQKSVFST